MTSAHKRSIKAIIIFVVLACGFITMSQDYNTCRNNGNSVAMCTGRS